MCTSKSHTQSESFEKKFSLAEFFNSHWRNYLVNPKFPITPAQHKAVKAIRQCRTSALGKDVYACNDCGKKVEVFFSCKHRFCPNCSWNETVKWADVVYNQLLNVPHRHVVMTLPHSLNKLIRLNPEFFYQTLLSESANLMKDYMKRNYNVDIGVIAVLHTFGERKNFHVHVHMIVSWGGIDKENRTLKTVPISDRVDYHKFKDLFRTRILSEIDKSYKSKELKHSFENGEAYNNFIVELQAKPWILHLEAPMNVPAQVIRYIGRYSKRACLSEYKITKMEGESITFKYKDYKQKDSNGKAVEKELTLHYHDFFPLLLQHVPIERFRLVRYYGVYATRTKILDVYKQKPVYTEHANNNQPFIDERKTCKSCKGSMSLIDTQVNRGSTLWFINQRKKAA